MRAIIVARKPPIGSMAANVMTTDSGGLNLDACRVGNEVRFSAPATPGEETFMTSKRPDYDGKVVAGRWPANLLIEHLPECKCQGTKRVKSGNATLVNTTEGSIMGTIGPNGLRRMPAGTYGHADENNMETVEAWECAPDCPVVALDTMSGSSKSPKTFIRSVPATAHVYGAGVGHKEAGHTSAEYGDEGTAVRFFKTFGGSR